MRLWCEVNRGTVTIEVLANDGDYFVCFSSYDTAMQVAIEKMGEDAVTANHCDNLRGVVVGQEVCGGAAM